MGLDLVELTMRIEETFDVQIPDRIASELNTPGRVTDFILSQVEESPVPLSCLSQRAFYLLRREFTQRLSLPRPQFVPDANLKEMLPEESRDEIWKNVGSALGVKRWPELSRSVWSSFFTPRVQTVEELIDHLLANEPQVVKGKEFGWSRRQVWEVLERVIRDETSVTNFSEDSRFVEDMHLD